MREIKFRQAIFKDGEFDRFHYWGFVGYRKEFIGPINISGINLPYAVLESDQYMEREDKIGKEIFEKDILQEKMSKAYLKNTREGTPPIRYYVCEWENNGFYLKSQHKYPWQEHKFWYHIESDCEIIGNIHENPELVSG